MTAHRSVFRKGEKMAKDVIIRNVEYDEVPWVDIPLASGNDDARFIDSSDATLSNGGQMLKDVTAYSKSTKYTGTIETKTSSDLSASGATVTVPSGYYASQATKSVSSGSATPASSISATGASVSTGTNTLTLSKSVSNTPQVSAGYVSSGTSGNSSVSLTASVATKGATTYTPTTSDQEIASGTYLTGKITIAGDADLVSSSIVEGKTIFNVQGSAKVPVISQDSITHGLSIS